MEGGAFNTFAPDDRIPSACVYIYIYIRNVGFCCIEARIRSKKYEFARNLYTRLLVVKIRIKLEPL